MCIVRVRHFRYTQHICIADQDHGLCGLKDFADWGITGLCIISVVFSTLSLLEAVKESFGGQGGILEQKLRAGAQGLFWTGKRNEKLTFLFLFIPEIFSIKAAIFSMLILAECNLISDFTILTGLSMNSNVVEPQVLSDILELIGKKLTHLRIAKGYSSYAEFAMAHDLPVAQYWRMEKGRVNMTLKSLHKVVSIHGLTLEQLFVEIMMERNS